MYFVANWKMFGDLGTLNTLNKVITFVNKIKKNKFELIYCPPSTLIYPLVKMLKTTSIFLMSILTLNKWLILIFKV